MKMAKKYQQGSNCVEIGFWLDDRQDELSKYEMMGSVASASVLAGTRTSKTRHESQGR